MKREVSSYIAATVAARSELVLSIAVSDGTPLAEEQLAVTLDGASIPAREIVDAHGTRLHLVDATAGELEVTYRAVVDQLAPPRIVEDAERIRYLRPSRYCESDTLAPTAAAEFNGIEGAKLLDAVSSWVGTHLSYVSGSSQPTDGAIQTLLSRQGVCRDFAHLVVALLRACEVPARVVSVYAPGLEPMDFHAVAEAAIGDRWCVVDATALAPRSSMLRIATGRDASDTAFLTNQTGALTLNSLEVTATVDQLPEDDVTQLTQLR
ncbi:transglutaminase-like domain-containing protein [Tessaracoccus caeni]|uniref:transglutaminase-like domain-containing protein n=1 Tax=Tessaracoccus caeni TaxID=3031239 RepID=UPI0023D9CF1C|nr:transglutaminase family protein [Tessaracoccus caeni]MDF1489061.1 transglutaminase family protein [Tessaracoccus caeni]